MDDYIEWRKLPVHRDSCFEILEKRLCSTKGSTSDDAIFSTVKELMVFAALIGFETNDFKPLESKVGCIPILLETYAKTHHDSYIYIIALSQKPSLDIIKNENLKEAIYIFEGYCNAGLKHIDNWFMNNIGEDVTSDIIFNEVLNHLITKN